MTTLLSLPMTAPAKLVDTFGRRHNNLRISVTDRCNLRCRYCMPEEAMFLDRRELLSFEEIVQVVRAAAPLGIDKVRLTGGEPLLRRGLPDLVRQLAAVPGLFDLGLTTNGILLAEQAAALYQAGLRRINISLDTLDADQFRRLTRRDGLERVLAGIEAAQSAGFHPIKINAISMRGWTESQVAPLACFARQRGLELRFIEYMPIGDEGWRRDQVLFAYEILEILEREIGPLVPAAAFDPRSPAMDFDYLDGQGRVGIIASVSRPFCKSCNRLRLTAEGKLRNCLFALDEADIRSLLRGGGTLADIQTAFRQSVHSKWEGHEINSARFIKPARIMHAIGG